MWLARVGTKDSEKLWLPTQSAARKKAEFIDV
jgi:hypothetical protein